MTNMDWRKITLLKSNRPYFNCSHHDLHNKPLDALNKLSTSWIIKSVIWSICPCMFQNQAGFQKDVLMLDIFCLCLSSVWRKETKLNCQEWHGTGKMRVDVTSFVTSQRAPSCYSHGCWDNLGSVIFRLATVQRWCKLSTPTVRQCNITINFGGVLKYPTNTFQ